MVKEGTDRKYRDYLDRNNTRWCFGNGILYKMCEEFPKHDDSDVITGKLLLIGRSYAAAIERRKNASDYTYAA